MRTDFIYIGIVCSAAFVLGCAVSLLLQSSSGTYAALRVYSASGTTVPTVHITGIYNQQLRGSVHGNVRFVLGDEVPALQPNAEFNIPAGVLLTHHVTLELPEGMQFVASKNGSKYYSVYSKSAQRLTPGNRVYFATAQAAEEAGYTR